MFWSFPQFIACCRIDMFIHWTDGFVNEYNVNYDTCFEGNRELKVYKIHMGLSEESPLWGGEIAATYEQWAGERTF